ncbi:MAG TPA: hypothetical protein VF049_05125 [Nocardioidaceae bacterium]
MLVIVAGVTLAALGVRSQHWLVVAWGALLALAGVSGVDRRLRGPSDAGYQRTMIAGLALLAGALPRNVALADPQTGRRFCAQWRRGFLTLVAADPADEVGEEPATVRRYLLALLGAPAPAPLTCHVEPVDAPMTWTALNEALRASAKTGGMETSTAELEQLLDQLGRVAELAEAR